MEKKENLFEISPQLLEDIKEFCVRRYHAVALLLLFLVGIFAYLPSFHAGFQFDDYDVIVDNPLIKRLDLPTLWSHYHVRFLTNLTFVANYVVGGLNVAGWHIFNFLIHVAASFLVYRLTDITLKTPRFKTRFNKHESFSLALGVALLFLVHPLQTQAVTYIVQRATSLSAVFYFGAVYFYAKARLTKEGKNYIWTIAFSFLGMFTKPIIITLPLAIVLYDIYFLEKDLHGQKMRWLLWGYLILPVIIIPYGLMGQHALMDAAVDSFRQIPPGHYFLTQFNVVAAYLKLLFFPVGQNIDYDFVVTSSFWDTTTILSCFLLLSILTLALILFRTKRLLSFGILWFFVTLGPQSSIFSLKDVIFEHRVYLASFGFCLFVITALYELTKYPQRFLLALYFLVGIFSVVTFERNNTWKDPVRFMEDVVSKSPNKARPHNNLGFFYYRKGQFLAAEQEYRAALVIDPGYYIAENNLATVYYEMNKLDEAGEIFTNLIRRYPQYPEPYIGLALVYQELGKNDTALRLFQENIRLNPLSAAAYNGIGNIEQIKGNLPAAKTAFQKAVWLNPDSFMAYYNLGNAYFKEGSFYDALLYYQKAVRLRKDFAEAYNNMGNIFFYFGDFEKAKENYNEAVGIDPSLAEGYFNLANALYELGFPFESGVSVRMALELYRNQGRLDKVEQIEKILTKDNL